MEGGEDQQRITHSATITVAGMEVRVRIKPDPVHTHKCAGCHTTFWYRRSHTLHSYNGEHYHMRVACPWCERGNYIQCDENGVPEEKNHEGE